jgi:hypothetical protein
MPPVVIATPSQVPPVFAPITAAVEESSKADTQQQDKLHSRKHSRDAATHAHSSTVDQRRDDDRGESNELQATKRKNVPAWQRVLRVNGIQRPVEKIVEEDREAGCERGSRRRARDQKLAPTVDKT